jgi:hypothetical protein
VLWILTLMRVMMLIVLLMIVLFVIVLLMIVLLMIVLIVIVMIRFLVVPKARTIIILVITATTIIKIITAIAIQITISFPAVGTTTTATIPPVARVVQGCAAPLVERAAAVVDRGFLLRIVDTECRVKRIGGVVGGGSAAQIVAPPLARDTADVDGVIVRVEAAIVGCTARVHHHPTRRPRRWPRPWR